MIVKYFLSVMLVLTVFGCNPTLIDDGYHEDIEVDSLGILDIYFVYRAQGIPDDRMKRKDLSLAYTADSLFRGDFFRSINVSDMISKYRLYLPPGSYYYQATIICLAGGDSCQYSEFPGGQFGLKMSGGKVELEANKTTSVTTQFH